MALALNLSVVERNDSKLVTFTDTSTGWGTEGDPSYTNIESKTDISPTYALVLNITINTSTETIEFDEIDLYDLAGPFATIADLVFEIDHSNLLISGNTLYTSIDLLPDGIWDISYKVQFYNVGTWEDVDEKVFSVLIYGDIKTQVYYRLRLVPNHYSTKILNSRDIQEPLLYYTFLQSIEKSAFVARREELLEMLET